MAAACALAAETQPATKTMRDTEELKKTATAWIEKAREIADKIHVDEDRDLLLTAVVGGFLDLGDFQNAETIIKKIKSKSARDYVDAAYAVDFNWKDPAAAVKAVGGLKDDSAKVTGVFLLLKKLLDADDLEHAMKLSELELPGAVGDIVLKSIIRYLVKLDHLQEAAELLGKIKDEETRTECKRDVDLRRLLFQKQGEGRREFIRQTSVEMGYVNDELDKALERRGDVLAKSGDFKGARELADLIEDETEKVRLLLNIAEELLEKGEKEESAAVLVQANGIRPKMSDIVTILFPAWVYYARIDAGDALAVIREIEASAEKDRHEVEGPYVRALFKVGMTKAAVERILKVNLNAILLSQNAELLGKEGRLEDAEYLIGKLSDPEALGHVRAGFALGLIKRAEKIEKSAKVKK